jgi:hypothetical protein
MAIADKMVSFWHAWVEARKSDRGRAVFLQIRAAKILDVPVIATEQRPQGSLVFPSYETTTNH